MGPIFRPSHFERNQVFIIKEPSKKGAMPSSLYSRLQDFLKTLGPFFTKNLYLGSLANLCCQIGGKYITGFVQGKRASRLKLLHGVLRRMGARPSDTIGRTLLVL